MELTVFSNFDQVFQNTISAYGVIDSALRLVVVNPAYCALVGQPAAVLEGHFVFDLFPETPERQALLTDAFNRALAGETTRVEEINYAIPEGSGQVNRWWTVTCTPMESATPCFLCHIEDVTDLVEARKKQDLYAAELQHRVGNVLNVVQVLTRRTGETVQSHEQYMAALDGRIAALGKTYAHLSGENWNGMSLHNILQQQLPGQLLLSPQAAVIEGPDWQLSVIHAQVFAISVHELVVNAVKTGALGHSDGRLNVTWDRLDDGSYRFDWIESGMQGLQPPQKTGFGTLMLLTLLPNQLGGTATQDFTPTGMQYHLTIPADVAMPVARDVSLDRK